MWIRDNWDKADQWPFEGLDSTVKKYRDTPHQTIGMSPYLYRFGRLRTPKERRERSQEILALKRLLASNETMMPVALRLRGTMTPYCSPTVLRRTWNAGTNTIGWH